MNPELEALIAEKKANEEKLAQVQRQINRYENRIDYYSQGERRKRAHRLITRGAAVESIAPVLQNMSETDFYALMEQILSMPLVKSKIAAATVKNQDNDN